MLGGKTAALFGEKLHKTNTGIFIHGAMTLYVRVGWKNVKIKNGLNTRRILYRNGIRGQPSHEEGNSLLPIFLQVMKKRQNQTSSQVIRIRMKKRGYGIAALTAQAFSFYYTILGRMRFVKSSNHRRASRSFHAPPPPPPSPPLPSSTKANHVGYHVNRAVGCTHRVLATADAFFCLSY